MAFITLLPLGAALLGVGITALRAGPELTCVSSSTVTATGGGRYRAEPTPLPAGASA